ncbi:MAG TPA: HEPN domain-containing protein [Peptococcaceae bacterium]|jgi:HEPN domain-containing protein|nr:HEPN domain-containing protein [Clostridia bacterium]HOB82529.1 HEPN domain-containing protein [Peptococcaceae bacterium]HPZ71152.1 HEPN domain-containing protein [Peptococcaceae bacterium]HQD54492.1 HEPN domain-containing protein [Peptococcaceae bacterium]
MNIWLFVINVNGVVLLGTVGLRNKCFALAKGEIRSAKILTKYNSEKKAICFHYHQAVENFLKGYLVYMTGILPEGHQLVRLCRLAMKHDHGFGVLLKDVAILDGYYYDENGSGSMAASAVLAEDVDRCLQSAQKTISKVRYIIKCENRRT